MENKAIAERLRQIIASRGLTMKAFAEASGITPMTLSRYMTGKSKIPERYIKKAAAMLGVTAAYIKGEETAPSDVQAQYDLPKAVLEASRQGYQISAFQECLKTLNVNLVEELIIGKTHFRRGKDLVWYPIREEIDTDPEWILYGLDNVSYLETIEKNPSICKVDVIMTYMGKELVMSYADNQKWLVSMIKAMEYRINDLFGVPSDVIVRETEIDRALAGKPFEFPE